MMSWQQRRHQNSLGGNFTGYHQKPTPREPDRTGISPRNPTRSRSATHHEAHAIRSLEAPLPNPRLQDHPAHLHPRHPFHHAPTSTTNPGFPSPSDAPSPSLSTPTLTPRCRTMIFRGFLASLPPNPHNPLPAHNPHIYTSDALTFTTDSRMAKTGDLRAPPTSGGNAATLSTGGAYVEALFWIAADTTTGESIQNQWRVRGRCYLLAEADADEATPVTDVLRNCLVPTTDDADADADAAGWSWSWRREVQAHFANLTPALRGSFANPPPGGAVGVPLGEWGAGRAGGAAGELVKGGRVPDGCVLDAEGHAARARANMRLGVIVPEVVERLDLAEDEGRARRWVYSKVGGEDGGDVVAGWKVEETWP